MSSENRRSSTSPLPPRKRRRSPSSSPGDSDDGVEVKRKRNDLSFEVCKDFTRSICRRSEIDCKFAHPHSTVSIENDRVTACADALRNKCFRGMTCRYYHPPPHIQETLLKASGVSDPKVEPICRDFMRGLCKRSAKECRFTHHSLIDESAVVCQDFLRGRCERKSCRYSHGEVHATAQVCLDFLRGRCKRQSCRYSHGEVRATSQVHLPIYVVPMTLPSSPPRAGNGQEHLDVCRDFLKKMCQRDSCKYAHPDSQISVIENQVQVCRDFRRGDCHRAVCRFYHPSKLT